MLKGAETKVTEMLSTPLALEEWLGIYADYLLANGVVVVDTDVISAENRPLISTIADYPIDEVISLMKAKEEGRIIVPPCKVGDKVAVRACCECVSTIPDNDECRYICPFEDDCECEDCDNANERIFNTEISSIFNDGFGWKVTFKGLSIIEANITDIGTSFFVGENAEQQAKEYEQTLKGGTQE